MTFNVAVTGCYWNEEKGQWRVTLREERHGQEPRDFEDYCDLLLNGTGILNNFKVRWSARKVVIDSLLTRPSGLRSLASKTSSRAKWCIPRGGPKTTRKSSGSTTESRLLAQEHHLYKR